MLFRIKRWIREQLTSGLLADLSIDQLRSLVDKFGYELRRKYKWTDPYENHQTTRGGTFSVFGEIGEDRSLMEEDTKAIRKLLKNPPRNPKPNQATESHTPASQIYPTFKNLNQ